MANNHEDLENKENQDVSAQESCQEAEADQAVTVEAVQAEKERLARVTANLSALTETGEATLAKVSVAAGILSDLAQERAK